MPSPRTILIIEDDSAIRCGIVDALEFSGYEVIQSAEGNSGKRQAIESHYELLLLDLGLPSVPGLEILRTVRKLRPSMPVIILTAKGEEADRIQGLSQGADDYVVKPFSVKELLARIEAVLRRSIGLVQRSQFNFEHGAVDFERREIRYHDGTRAELS
ncbi:MAG: response regulator, partial [Aureliella sp.]